MFLVEEKDSGYSVFAVAYFVFREAVIGVEIVVSGADVIKFGAVSHSIAVGIGYFAYHGDGCVLWVFEDEVEVAVIFLAEIG